MVVRVARRRVRLCARWQAGKFVSRGRYRLGEEAAVREQVVCTRSCGQCK